jgi:ribosomal protein S18 acetylase RimI-like enzyme
VTDADFATVRDIAWRSWANAYGRFIPEEDRREFFAAFYTEDGHRRAVRSARTLFVVAEMEEVPIAFLLAAHGPTAVQLYRLYTTPERARQGAGQALWDELVRWAIARGAARIAFEVATEGESGPAFYRKQGCRAVAETVMPVGRHPVRVTRYAFVVPRP